MGQREAERGQGRPPVGLWTTPLLALILIFIIPRGELGLTNDNTQGGGGISGIQEFYIISSERKNVRKNDTS